MKHRKPIWFYESVYGVNFYFLPGYTSEELTMAIKNNLDEHFEDKLKCAGLTVSITSKKGIFGIFIWLEKNEISKYMLSKLHHECIHASNNVLDRVGVLASFKNDEAQTYLSEWIFNKCLSNMKGKLK